MASPFNILQQSPYDVQPLPSKSSGVTPDLLKWVPSRYNVRAATEDGRLVLWNTSNGSMSIFKPEQVSQVQALLRQSGVESKREGLVKYLADRGFLIKQGTNEYQKIQMAFGRQHYQTEHLHLILLASEDCNFRCTYCYEKFARGTMEPRVRSSLKKLIEKRLPRLKYLHVSWFGGEPLYGIEAIEDLAPFFLKTTQEHSVGFHCGMTTNGYLLTPETADKLLYWQIRGFQITLDGNQAEHDCSRVARNGEGTFSRVFENLKAMHRRSEEFQIIVRINFDRHNYPHLNGFLDLLQQELQNDSRFKIHFKAVGRWGGDNDSNLDVCGTHETAEVKRDLEDEARRRGLNIGRRLKDVSSMGGESCYAARPYSFIIGASGKVMKCTIALDTADHNVVGAITENGELELDQDKMALWTEPAFQSDKKCQSCVVLPMCQGIHCPLIRIEEGRSPCTPLRMNLKQSLLDTYDLLQTQTRRAVIK